MPFRKIVPKSTSIFIVITLSACAHTGATSGQRRNVYAEMTFQPAIIAPAPPEYVASDYKSNHSVRLTAAQQKQIKEALAHSSINDRQYLRFSFAHSENGSSRNVFVIFSNKTQSLSVGDVHLNYKVVNSDSCNLEYDPQNGTIFASTQC